MNRTLPSLACALLLACGGSAPAPAPAPAPAAEDLDRRLTRAECAQSVDHAISLFTADPDMAPAAAMMRDGREKFTAQCETTATLRDHRCLMNAKTSRELGLCPMPGAR